MRHHALRRCNHGALALDVSAARTACKNDIAICSLAALTLPAWSAGLPALRRVSAHDTMLSTSDSTGAAGAARRSTPSHPNGATIGPPDDGTGTNATTLRQPVTVLRMTLGVILPSTNRWVRSALSSLAISYIVPQWGGSTSVAYAGHDTSPMRASLTSVVRSTVPLSKPLTAMRQPSSRASYARAHASNMLAVLPRHASLIALASVVGSLTCRPPAPACATLV